MLFNPQLASPNFNKSNNSSPFQNVCVIYAPLWIAESRLFIGWMLKEHWIVGKRNERKVLRKPTCCSFIYLSLSLSISTNKRCKQTVAAAVDSNERLSIFQFNLTNSTWHKNSLTKQWHNNDYQFIDWALSAACCSLAVPQRTAATTTTTTSRIL